MGEGLIEAVDVRRAVGKDGKQQSWTKCIRLVSTEALDVHSEDEQEVKKATDIADDDLSDTSDAGGSLT
jgi:hypothetical protein